MISKRSPIVAVLGFVALAVAILFVLPSCDNILDVFGGSDDQESDDQSTDDDQDDETNGDGTLPTDPPGDISPAEEIDVALLPYIMAAIEAAAMELRNDIIYVIEDGWYEEDPHRPLASPLGPGETWEPFGNDTVVLTEGSFLEEWEDEQNGHFFIEFDGYERGEGSLEVVVSTGNADHKFVPSEDFYVFFHDVSGTVEDKEFELTEAGFELEAGIEAEMPSSVWGTIELDGEPHELVEYFRPIAIVEYILKTDQALAGLFLHVIDKRADFDDDPEVTIDVLDKSDQGDPLYITAEVELDDYQPDEAPPSLSTTDPVWVHQELATTADGVEFTMAVNGTVAVQPWIFDTAAMAFAMTWEGEGDLESVELDELLEGIPSEVEGWVAIDGISSDMELLREVWIVLSQMWDD